MKTLILLRHAKSSWKDMSQDDFDRPLNKRGKRDAPLMAQKFKERELVPDLILSSPAVRTKLTTEEFVYGLGGGGDEGGSILKYVSQIYEAHYQALLQLLRQQEDIYQSILLVGHNPGLTDLANYFSFEYIENIPTTGIICFDLPINQWRQINSESASLVYFDFPKNYFPKQES